ncbi:MAG: putative lipoprotein YerB precursor [candidate division WS2 bacterium ADurb.Bin280]|uniref:Putative lipoprotein YerB n=1 Tax=candidate division WS2 bacterium ADurb.Bin280 TaxID=1852829 RepID=A0A1V5SG97_9BACT|nr:MAG: putative lipoprotein YerB precursor [candidate division WS2 bacterium ADurb.Bin280]
MADYIDPREVKASKQKKLKTAAIITLVVAIFIIGGALAATRFNKNDAKIPGKEAVQSTTKTPELQICQLDGMSYSPDKANRHPLAVIVENHPDARPQSGLADASIVYEAITEGGITRFMAIFGPTDAKEIGPIRSARLFFMDFLKEYDAFFAHAGGNEDALANIGNYGIKDLNHSSKYFQRDYKGRSVASEHTLYSSTDQLYEYAKSKNYNIDSGSYQTLKFKADTPVSEGGKGIEINFSGSQTYAVKWTYNQSTNNYSRFMAAVEHKDRNTGAQITAKNIIIQEVSRTLQPHGSYGSENWVFDTIGSGNAKVLRDGQIIEATWKKADRTSRTKFFDANGTEIQFNPGNTWYEIAAKGTTKTTEI